MPESTPPQSAQTNQKDTPDSTSEKSDQPTVSRRQPGDGHLSPGEPDDEAGTQGD